MRIVSLEKSVSPDVELKGIVLVPYEKYRAIKCEENLRRKPLYFSEYSVVPVI